MLPINDSEPNRYSGFPAMVIAIILVNIFVWIWEFSLEQQSYYTFITAIRRYGVTPALIFSRQGLGAFSSIAAVFLHGDLWHLIGNMFPLWVFGRRIEDACGPWRFLVFYLVCGVFANIAYILIHLNSSIPAIGASGAVAGLMGAYLLLFPSGRIRTLFLFLPFLPIFPKIRAYWIILYFIIWQILPAYRVYVGGTNFGVAYWAHIGGFLSAAFVVFFLRPEAFQRYINGLPI